jgi:transposase
MDKITKIQVCWKLYSNGVSAESIPKEINVNRATVYRWLHGIKLKGMSQFIQDYKTAKKGHRHRKTDAIIKDRIYSIRESKRHCCGEKIQFFLRKNFNQTISVTTIYRILNEKYVLSSKWKKNTKRGKVLRGTKPREVIQVDTVDFGAVYAFTSIDTYTREVSVVLQPTLEAKSGEISFAQHLRDFGSIENVQRDGGSEFKKEARKTHSHSKTLQEK